MHEDVKCIKVVWNNVGAKVPIRVDVNQGWGTYIQALPLAKTIEDGHLSWLEQPIQMGDLDGLVKLKDKLMKYAGSDPVIHLAKQQK